MNSKIKIDISSQAPVYKQLIQGVQNLVDAGEYAEGDYIPSMNELAEELEISNDNCNAKCFIHLQNSAV